MVEIVFERAGWFKKCATPRQKPDVEPGALDYRYTMVIDTRELPDRTALHFDVCIVGAGAAGITLARALQSRRLTIGVLESGGLEFDARVQALYEGTTTSATLPRRYLTTSRLRFFGGSTNHWNGMCRPLDPLDFSRRPWVADSGWPITHDDLAPYYRQAADVLQFAPLGDDRGDIVSHAASIIPPQGPFVGRQFRMSPPTRFGQVYRDELVTAANVDVMLWASAVRLDANEAGNAVERLHVTSLAGRTVTVAARVFVLATGGVENARLLLASRTVQSTGLGNQSDCVGRYFMEHPECAGIRVMITNHDVFGDLFRERHRMLGPTADAQQTHEMLNVNIQFIPDSAPPVSESGTTLDMAEAVKALDAAAPATAEPLPDYLSCYLRAESAPHRDNRVTLDEHDVDALGLPRARLRFAMGDLETRTIAHTVRLLAGELGSRAAGRLQFAHPEEALTVAFGEPPWRGLQHGSHHIGTTRMSQTPATGVVTGDCQVHGIENLFIAGSSVFPTAGMANPTYTIVALSLRLADHVAARLAGVAR